APVLQLDLREDSEQSPHCAERVPAHRIHDLRAIDHMRSAPETGTLEESVRSRPAGNLVVLRDHEDLAVSRRARLAPAQVRSGLAGVFGAPLARRSIDRPEVDGYLVRHRMAANDPNGWERGAGSHEPFRIRADRRPPD